MLSISHHQKLSSENWASVSVLSTDTNTGLSALDALSKCLSKSQKCWNLSIYGNWGITKNNYNLSLMNYYYYIAVLFNRGAKKVWYVHKIIGRYLPHFWLLLFGNVWHKKQKSDDELSFVILVRVFSAGFFLRFLAQIRNGSQCLCMPIVKFCLNSAQCD